MVAFSCCLYDEGRAGKAKLKSIREKGWGNKFTKKDRVIRPDLNRLEGRCPLSPLEVFELLTLLHSTLAFHSILGLFFIADHFLISVEYTGFWPFNGFIIILKNASMVKMS